VLSLAAVQLCAGGQNRQQPRGLAGAWAWCGLKGKLSGNEALKTSCLAEPDQWTFVTIVTNFFGQKDYLVVSMYATSAM